MVPNEQFRHDALFYASAEEFVDHLAPFVRDGVNAGEPVLVLVPPDRMARLQWALGRLADGVFFADMTRVGHNPARIIPVWQDFVAAHAPDRPARGIGEPMYPSRGDAERAECHVHEALLNVALANAPIWIMCPYDVRAFSACDLEAARRTHCGRDDFEPRTRELFAAPLPEPPNVEPVAFDLKTLAKVRYLVDQGAERYGLDPTRRAECVLVMSEIATNSIMYGGGGTFRSWTDAGRFVCEIRDAGHIDDPMAGRVRPVRHQHSGRGLWLANLLADLVQVRSNEHGTTVRVHLDKAS